MNVAVSGTGVSEAGTGVSDAGAGVFEAGTDVFEAGTDVSDAGIGVFEAGTGVSEAGTGVFVGFVVAEGGIGVCVFVAGAGVDVLTMMDVAVDGGACVGGIGVDEGGTGVKVSVKNNLNCVGVGSRGDKVEKFDGINVIVGGSNVSEGTAPEPVAVTAPGKVGVP